MREAPVDHTPAARAVVRRRFEDVTAGQPDDVTSFFFDLKLLLPAGLPAADVQSARAAVERRLDRTVRRKDSIVWTADGFFLAIATTDPARAGAAAERIQQDICAILGDKEAQPADAVCAANHDNHLAVRKASATRASSAAAWPSSGQS